MKKTSLILFVLMVASSASPQQYTSYVDNDPNASCQTIYKVAAASGVIMRSEPNTRSEQIGKIPNRGLVSVCSICDGKTETIEGIEAPWMKVCFRKKCGYVFGGFLKKGSSFQLLFPGQEMTVSQMSSTSYVAIIQDPYAGFYTRLQPLEPLLTGNTCDPEKMEKNKILFLVDGIKSRGRLGQVYFGTGALLPGEKLDLSGDKGFIYSTGTTDVEGNDLIIKDYKLMMISGGEMKLLYDHTFSNDTFHPDEPVEVLWAGDLDGDRIADVIVKDGKSNVLTLLLSSVAEKGYTLRQVSQAALPNL
jgi:hypothetical protein